MSFSYLQPSGSGYTDEQQDLPLDRPTGGIQFQIPEYLLDTPPTLAPGGGAEALHPAQAAQWFTNSGFQYPQYTTVLDAYDSIENLQTSFQTPYNPYPQPYWALNTSPAPEQPSPLTSAGLPVYSQSGFDVVSLLSRVQNRLNPIISLGPVDFTTSFVVVDVRRHDDPIVYCSPNFCSLTGYTEREVIGRNCRFLQAPPPSPAQGVLPLAKGDIRRHTSGTAVNALAKAVVGRKETQVSVVNYRKDGSAFVNLVSVVPLFGEHTDDPAEECVWFVGFQIDLTKQSEGIVQRVREGTYYAGAVVAISNQARIREEAKAQQQPTTVEQSTSIPTPTPTQARERRSTTVPPPRVSAVLARFLSNPVFLNSCGLQPPLPGAGHGLAPDPTSHALHSLLLGQLPDFVHVLSLKGAFLYVAPAVTRVLGWAPSELVGRALADVCFKSDVVSVGRALKEASLPVEGVRIEGAGEKDEKGTDANADSNSSSSKNTKTTDPNSPALTPAEALRTVDLVFRARTKQGSWVWVECRGRLHVEPGKGRKAIVLIGRARGMAKVPLGTSLSGGVGELRVPDRSRGQEYDYYGQQRVHSSTSSGSHTPASPTYPQAPHMQTQRRSPTGSVSGLEFALQPKRPRIEDSQTSTLRTPSPDFGTSAAVPTAFHGLLDPHGLLLSVGFGARALLGWDPLALRGTRLGALVASDARLSAAGAPSPVDALLAAWRADRAADPANAAAGGAAREVRCTLRGRAGPVDAVVRVVAPLPEPPVPGRTGPALPPAVAPARLMYAVRKANALPVQRAADEDVFRRLDPAMGGSWQYELQQLRFANARLEEEIGELERAERERAAEKERERERERERIRMVYQQQQQQQVPQMYGYDLHHHHQQWGYDVVPPPQTYQLPMKRPWDQRDGL